MTFVILIPSSDHCREHGISPTAYIITAVNSNSTNASTKNQLNDSVTF